MEFREFLEKPRLYGERIRQLQDRYEMLSARSGYVRSEPSQTPKAKSSYLSSVTENYVARMAECENLIAQFTAARDAACADLILLFSELEDGRQMKVLAMRYVDLQSFDEIAQTLRYSSQHVFRLHKAGLEAAEKLYLKRKEYDESTM